MGHMKEVGHTSRRRTWIGIAAALILFAATVVAVIVVMRAPRTNASSQSARASDPAKPPSSRPIVAANHAPRISLSKLPLSFEPNVGQSDPHVKFLSHGQGYTLFLTAGDAVLSMRSASPRDADGSHVQSCHPHFPILAKPPAPGRA